MRLVPPRWPSCGAPPGTGHLGLFAFTHAALGLQAGDIAQAQRRLPIHSPYPPIKPPAQGISESGERGNHLFSRDFGHNQHCCSRTTMATDRQVHLDKAAQFPQLAA
jgi:hypothetical protein